MPTQPQPPTPSFEYPPYGYFPKNLEDSPEGQVTPTDWPGRPGPARDKHCTEWVKDLAGELGEVLWPHWLEKECQWKAGPANDAKHELTVADFRLLEDLQPMLGHRVTSKAATDVRHGDLFVIEDEGGAVGDTLAAYAPDLLDRPLQKFAAIWNSGASHKAGTLSVRLKRYFRRPRALQVAALMGRKYRHTLAKTATTSAFTSGHGLQGIVGMAAVHAALCAARAPTPAESAALEQIAVDIGDRRVFAGAHYPSDNVGSWIVALRLAPMVFADGPAAKAFIAAAIRHSAVYRALEQGGHEAHAPGLELLRRELR